MRYLIGLLAAGVLIGAAVAFVRRTQHTVHAIARADFEAQLPASLQMQIAVSDLLVRFRFVLIPAALVICVGAAFALSPFAPRK